MDETGFDFLDSVDSQAKLISAFEQMSLVRPGLKYEIALIIPYLICGNDAEANRLIIHNYENERSIQYFTTTWDSDLKAEDKQRALQYGRELRKATLSEDNLRALMKKNLDTNLSHADKYGLQIREGFQPLV